MSVFERERGRYRRRVKSLRTATKVLFENKIISKKERVELERKAARLERKLKLDFRRTCAPHLRPRGRPKKIRAAPVRLNCQYNGCTRSADKNGKWCSKKHSPYNHLWVADDQLKKLPDWKPPAGE
jgi:hypothetical protein